jgi:hypothetical protein
VRDKNRIPSVRAEARPPEEMSESQIETLLNFGKRESALMDRLEVAARAGDKDEVWKIAQEYCRVEDEVAKA